MVRVFRILQCMARSIIDRPIFHDFFLDIRKIGSFLKKKKIILKCGRFQKVRGQGDGHLCVKFQYSTSDLTKILLFVLLMFKRHFLIFISQKCESIMFNTKSLSFN